MERIDSIESIKERYGHTLSVDNGSGKRVEAGIFGQWAFSFTNVTLFLFLVELPGHDGNLMPIEMGVKPHSKSDIELVNKIGKIKIFNYPKPNDWEPMVDDI